MPTTPRGEPGKKASAQQLASHQAMWKLQQGEEYG